VEQFIKITVAAAGRSVTVPQGQYWGDVYTPIGLELGFVLPGEFTDYKRPITRAEMARIIVRALPSITGEKDITYDANVIKSRMVDYDSIPANLKDYVCKCYQLGILVGGSDKKFNPNGTLTRASAAAVIHNMLDPTVRTPVVVDAASEMWSDAEFEAYLRSSDGTYVNVNAISKVENGKVYWKPDGRAESVLLPEERNPGINDMVYNVIKIMAYHTVKTKGYLLMSYSDKILGGVLQIRYYISKQMHNVVFDGDIAFCIYDPPIKSWTGDKYFPGQQKGFSTYNWVFGALHTSEDIRGYELGMDRSEFTWTAPRYEIIIKEVFNEVYGPSQGAAFYEYVIQEIDKLYLDPDHYTASYIGAKPQMGFELIHHYPDIISYPQFWTSKPEERK